MDKIVDCRIVPHKVTGEWYVYMRYKNGREFVTSESFVTPEEAEEVAVAYLQGRRQQH